MCFSSPKVPEPAPLPATPTPRPEGPLQSETDRMRRRANALQATQFTTPLGATNFGQSSQAPTLGGVGTSF